MPHFPPICRLAVLPALLGLALAAATGDLATAGEVKLKNGMVLRGTPSEVESLLVGPRKVDSGPITIYPILMISTPLKRYFVPRRPNEQSINRDVDLTAHDAFKIPQQKLSGGSKIISTVGPQVGKARLFDNWGRRTIHLEMTNGDTPVIQGVTRITPEYMQIIALNFIWETAMATSSVPLESLDAMLRQVTDENNSDDRLKIASFYIQAGFFESADRELDAIRYKFPELAKTVNQVQTTLAQARAQTILGELKHRRAAGQHQFVYEKARSFPAENVAAPILREFRDIVSDYDRAGERKEQAVAELGEFQAQLKDDPRVKEIAPLRAELCENLNYTTLNRLDAFFRLSGDPQLKPDEKLALALSGWVVGSANAVTEINQTLRLWQARFLLQEYLRSPHDAATERKEILGKLESLEGVGPERIAQLLPFIAPPLEAVETAAGRAVRIEVADPQEGAPAAYWVSLPLEYHPDHSYPLIVALHGERGKPQQELQGFWGGTEEKAGQSQRHGYIVIAPEYVRKSESKGYDYNGESHQIVLESLRDARRRFSVDSDRVFLAGHDMGGDAAWDMGLAHPHLFAGIIPINAAIDRHAKWYLDNGRQLPIYAIAGEFDIDLMNRNGNSLMYMMQHNYDLIYAEYTGAGPDSFYSEIHSLFEWMGKQKRPPLSKQVTAKTLRETDNRFYWLEFSGIPEVHKAFDWTRAKPRAAKPMPVSATINPGNVLRIKSGAAHYRVWLGRGEGQADFEKRLKVEINGSSRWNDFIKPDVSAMLEHVRIHGDRQQLYWAVLEF